MKDDAKRRLWDPYIKGNKIMSNLFYMSPNPQLYSSVRGEDLKIMTFHKISNKEKIRDHLLENNNVFAICPSQCLIAQVYNIVSQYANRSNYITRYEVSGKIAFSE